MSPTETERTKQIAVRLDKEIAARLDAIVSKMARPGLRPSLTGVVQMVLLAGLPLVEAAEGLAPKAAKKGAQR